MTILGIDYGTRWLGLALGNAETQFAFPYTTLEQGKLLFSQLAEVCRKERVEKIVIGLPTIWHTTQFIQSEIREFGDQLQKSLGVEVAFAEELFTSALAKTMTPKNARHSSHAEAATLILENYFFRYGYEIRNDTNMRHKPDGVLARTKELRQNLKDFGARTPSGTRG